MRLSARHVLALVKSDAKLQALDNTRRALLKRGGTRGIKQLVGRLAPQG